jgi:hypothetical protein
MQLFPVPIGIGPVPGGGACNRELRRIPLLGTSMYRPSGDASGSTRWHHVI